MLLGIGERQPGRWRRRRADDASPRSESSRPRGPTAPPAPTPQIYIVAKGDTMSRSRRKFDLTVEQLLAANPKIKNPNRIAIGDEIDIPVPEDDAGG